MKTLLIALAFFAARFPTDEPPKSKVWFETSWDSGKSKTCETYSDMPGFLLCDTNVVPKDIGDCLKKISDAMMKPHNAQTSPAETTMDCVMEARKNAAEKAKEFRVKYSQNPTPKPDLASPVIYIVSALWECTKKDLITCTFLRSENLQQADKNSAPGAFVESLQRMAEAGNLESQYRLALLCFGPKQISPDDAEGLRWLRNSADAGYAPSQVLLGQIYGKGTRGAQRNAEEAVGWFRKAAEFGSPQAQSELGLMYEQGEGVSKDEVEAVRWYTLAANQGLAIAQFDLAYMYEEGKGVAKNPQRAAELYEIAAVQIPTARYNLATLYFIGDDSFPDNSIQAYKWSILAISAEWTRLLAIHAAEGEELHRAYVLNIKISKNMSDSAKKSGRSLAAQWIHTHSGELGDEPRDFQLRFR